ncbi:UDP-2,4-diacetamido-2,4,6-trideoxy-beta-L-altropyranose hydrolase [Vibrio sp. NH-UV-68]|uniref:UDP-2,4-diacetamido-2,4, 6-trideoxy-beta-L-altropyranose hydrolase n=1 Tax=unclassified Vibrio TaxID=2614977 RepID=UPI0036F3F222
MNIVIRADSGVEIGTGHVMRCLTLAKALREKGHTITFVCKDHDRNIVSHLESEGFTVFLLPVDKGKEDALEHSKWLGGSQQTDAEQTIAMSTQYFEKAPDLVVVDHYGIDRDWHIVFKSYSSATKIFVIDDLADRNHECDYLLDQTFMRLDSDYLSCVPKHCQLMLGTQFALLRPEFALHNALAREVRDSECDKSARRVLVMMGGTDHLNVTANVLNAIREEASIAKITVVLGPTAPHRKTIEQTIGSDNRIELLSGVSNVAELMLEHDVCIGGAGAASWERCAMGLPSILVAFASNQKTILSKLNQFGAVSVFELDAQSNIIREQLNQTFDTNTYSKMVESCFKVSDGLGTQRVVGVLTQWIT